jgi:hypothetical protein
MTHGHHHHSPNFGIVVNPYPWTWNPGYYVSPYVNSPFSIVAIIIFFIIFIVLVIYSLVKKKKHHNEPTTPPTPPTPSPSSQQ